jgi:hypothetical protein
MKALCYMRDNYVSAGIRVLRKPDRASDAMTVEYSQTQPNMLDILGYYPCAGMIEGSRHHHDKQHYGHHKNGYLNATTKAGVEANLD